MALTAREQHYREGKITVLEGPQRSGKTLGMAILALDEYVVNKSEVLTNIAYENPATKQLRIPYKPLNFFELTMEKIGTFVNRTITIDELNFYLDCRGAMTKVNRRFCAWLLQSKKMGINTYGTTHNLHYLDLRFVDNFDFLITPTTLYRNALDEHGNVIIEPDGTIRKIPEYLILQWVNGPNQARFRRKIVIDFKKKPHLLGLYNSRHTFNPFAEMEEQMALEKLQEKERNKERRRSQTPLQKLVPDWKPNQPKQGSRPSDLIGDIPDFLKSKGVTVE